MTKLKKLAGVGAAALAIAMISGAASAQQQVSRAISMATSATNAGAAAQSRIDKLDDKKSDIVGDYRAALQEQETVGLNVDQQRIFLQSQENEIESLQNQIARVGEVQDALLPMMLQMIGNLEKFVDQDVPFQLQDRKDRIEKLKELMQDPDVSPSERYRQIINAYQIELAYGNQTVSYEGNVMINGAPTKVEFLRIGRVVLIYKDSENNLHIWSQAKKAYEPLSSSYNLDYSTATRIALEQKSPEVFAAPLPGATKVN